MKQRNKPLIDRELENQTENNHIKILTRNMLINCKVVSQQINNSIENILNINKVDNKFIGNPKKQNPLEKVKRLYLFYDSCNKSSLKKKY